MVVVPRKKINIYQSKLRKINRYKISDIIKEIYKYEDPEIIIKCLNLKIKLSTMRIATNSLLMIFGEFKNENDITEICILKNFDGKNIDKNDFYSCTNCNL